MSKQWILALSLILVLTAPMPAMADPDEADEQILVQRLDALEAQVQVLIAAGAGGGATPARQFVGFTTTPVRGSGSIGVMNALCRDEQAGAAMCTTPEIQQSSILPPPGAPGQLSWVNPVYVAVGNPDFLIDVSGIREDDFVFPNGTSDRTISCKNWTDQSNASSGMVLFTQGLDSTEAIGNIERGPHADLGLGSCSDLKPVACCR